MLMEVMTQGKVGPRCFPALQMYRGEERKRKEAIEEETKTCKVVRSNREFEQNKKDVKSQVTSADL